MSFNKLIIAVSSCLLLIVGCAEGQSTSILGFEIEDPLIPVAEIKRGGPPKDGIPSIDTPVFSSSDQYDHFSDKHRVLGVNRHGIAKAYPIGILNWHEIVNDEFDGEPVVVTYCPLCGSGVAFSSEVGDEVLTFGVSGLLYNSDVLLYDRETESLWSQILMKAISGQYKGTDLKMLPTANTTLGEWKRRHPNTLVLTTNTGFRRDYQRDPYGGYADSESLYFPVAHTDKRLPAKELVLGIEVDAKFKAYPFSKLKKQKGETIEDKFKGKAFRIVYDKKSKSAYVLDEAGKTYPAVTLYWFAWYAFHPDTAVYK